MMVEIGLTDKLSDVKPPVLKLVPVQEAASVEDQVSVAELPWKIDVGLTEILAVEADTTVKLFIESVLEQ